MAPIRNVALLACLVGASALEGPNPVAKVITLIEGLKTEVEDEGKAEAKAYGDFACFCKDTNSKKSKSVRDGSDSIERDSADIADKTQHRKDDITELGERKANQEQLSKDLQETTARCTKEKAEYDEEAADLQKAISSLKSAIKAMKTTGGAASLIAINSVVKTLSAAKMTSSQKAVASLLQQKVDPSDPNYGYHSQDIIDLCGNLLGEFKTSKDDLDTEWGKTDKACVATKKSINKEMGANTKAMNALDKNIEILATEIAKHREDLVEAESTLKDDELYLKDLTAQCENRANDYDQRSQMRANEGGALQQALDILTNDVKDADTEVNARASLLQKAPQAKKSPQAKAVVRPVSFLQEASIKAHSQNFLAKSSGDASLALEARKNRALDMLRSEGRRIGSVTIASLTVRMAADPFKKVKGLIQKLIERLLEESKNEATKKGFCDTAMGQAESDRDARYEQANDLNREIKSLKATEDSLDLEIKELTKAIKDEKKDLKDATDIRKEEKDDNAKALQVATDGHEAVTNALSLLRSFYSGAAKASLIQASPLDEDTAGAGFSGNYKGKQGGMKAVFALLEVIQSDFDRTMRKTEESEAQAHRAYIEFMQNSESSIAGKSTKKELDEQDLKSTRTKIKQKMSDLQANMDLLDDALAELENLKPSCVDTGMSYKERVEKREEEISALKTALCQLDTDKVEALC